MAMRRLIDRRCVHVARCFYIQNARTHAQTLPTDFFQKSLPVLPFPNLKDTLSGYLDQQQGVLEAKDFLKLQKMTNDFHQNYGKTLNDMLFTEYQTDKEIYGGLQYMNQLLRWRNPLLKQTYGSVHFEVDTGESQLQIASKLLYAIGMVQKSLRENTYKPMMINSSPSLERLLLQTPEHYRTQVAQSLGITPFNMKPFSKALSTSRIPGSQQDSFRIGKNSKNVVVIRNANMYSFDLIKDDGSVMTVAELLANLKYIYQQSEKPAESQVAVLTALERQMWAGYRHHLLADQHNVDILKKVEESITVLSLDGKYDETTRGKYVLFGGNAGNRWFDRSLSLSVDEEARFVGWSSNVTEVHISVVGNIANRVMHIYRNVPTSSQTPASNSSPVELLTFKVDDRIQTGIQLAKREFDNMQKNYQCIHFEMENVNLKEFNKRHIHPESVLNIVNQIALIKLLGQPQNVDVPIFIPNFINSHYSVIFTSWESTVDIARSFISKGTLDIDSLRLHSEKYESYLAQTVLGLVAVESHLKALENYAVITGKRLDFFKSELFQKSLSVAMDFSYVPYEPIRHLTYTGFDGGLAFGYHLDTELFTGCITSSQDWQPSSKDFMMVFEETLGCFHQFISNN